MSTNQPDTGALEREFRTWFQTDEDIGTRRAAREATEIAMQYFSPLLAEARLSGAKELAEKLKSVGGQPPMWDEDAKTEAKNGLWFAPGQIDSALRELEGRNE